MIGIHSLARLVFCFTLFTSWATLAAQPIRIGVSVGLTGANSVIAPAIIQSSQLAVEQINAAGGILGRKVELEIADNASNAEGAIKAHETLIFQKKVNAIIATELSVARNAALPIIARGKIPYIYASFYEGRSCSPWMYVNGFVPEQQVAPIVDFLTKTKNVKSVFLIGSDYVYGRGILDFTAKYVKQAGVRVVGEEYLPIDGSDWSRVIAKIRATKPDALISATAGGTPNLSLAKQLRAAGITATYANLSLDEGTAKAMGADAAGILFTSSYLIRIDSEENKTFLLKMLIKFGAELKAPNELSVPQYEGFFLYKAAVEKAKSFDSELVVKTLGEVSITGPRGMIQMNKSRHAPLAMRLGQVRSDGSVRVLQTFPSVDPGDQCSTSN